MHVLVLPSLEASSEDSVFCASAFFFCFCCASDAATLHLEDFAEASDDAWPLEFFSGAFSVLESLPLETFAGAASALGFLAESRLNFVGAFLSDAFAFSAFFTFFWALLLAPQVGLGISGPPCGFVHC